LAQAVLYSTLGWEVFAQLEATLAAMTAVSPLPSLLACRQMRTAHRESLFRSTGAHLLGQNAASCQGPRVGRSQGVKAWPPLCEGLGVSQRFDPSSCGQDLAPLGDTTRSHAIQELERLLDLDTEGQAYDAHMIAAKAEGCCDDLSDVGTASTVFDSEMEDSIESSMNATTSNGSHMATMSPRKISSCSSHSQGAYPVNRGCARYWSRKPASWFKDIIDIDSTGKVDFRRFLAALRKHPGLQCALAEAAGVPFSTEERQAHRRLQVTGLLGPSARERSDLLLKERARIKQIFQQTCDSRDSTLESSSFLAFFYQRGLILDCM